MTEEVKTVEKNISREENNTPLGTHTFLFYPRMKQLTWLLKCPNFFSAVTVIIYHDQSNLQKKGLLWLMHHRVRS